jgi:precorrin-2 dehydrogenase / sirohydrochlorin ferrochelatase
VASVTASVNGGAGSDEVVSLVGDETPQAALNPPEQPIWFPILLSLSGRKCLVVGGGPIGSRKAISLRDAGAEVVLVATKLSVEALNLTGVTLIERPYESTDLEGAWLVITAVDNQETTAQVAADAAAAQVFMNASDDPPFCTSILPAIHRDGDVIVAVSTGGASPAAASWIRDRIAHSLGSVPAHVVRHVKAVRDDIRKTRTSEGLPWRSLISRSANALEALEANDASELARATTAWTTTLTYRCDQSDCSAPSCGSRNCVRYETALQQEVRRLEIKAGFAGENVVLVEEATTT